MNKVGPGLAAGLVVAGVHDPAHANEDLILGKEGAKDFRDGQGAIREGSTAQTPRFVGVFGGTLGSGSTEARACRRYYGTATCADPYDIGKPPMQNFRGSLETLTRMNVRFMRTVDSSIVGTIDAGMCVEVRDCMTGFNRDQLWCEVRVNDRTGWMLKEDADFVYSRNSCG